MRLYPKMGESTKQVRVDNWGIFFLQRLQMFFSKTDYCDMTLQFEGNVQLKVHRLVMNACTEYFQFLEQTCALEENVIMMPSDLQADVIVPIVNFMYTGMLEFHLSIFDRLYKTAQLMNITILTKLLDAQKHPVSSGAKSLKKRAPDSPMFNAQVKKPTPKPSPHSDLPAPLPGRKLPIWKRKTLSTPSHSSSPLCFSETKWSPSTDPLSVPDNTPKPTRFEWPEEDLPPLTLMDTSFEDISYTSKPLLTLEEENRASTSFDDLKQIPNANRSTPISKKSSPSLDMEEMKNYVKEQKIRSGLSQDEEAVDDLDVGESGVKRKAGEQKKGIVKKVRFDEQENKTTTISIATDGKGTGELNHEKIVTELLKKYPQLVKKNKNIRLKIMAKNKATALEQTKGENIQIRGQKLKMQVTDIQKTDLPKPVKPCLTSDSQNDNKSPWKCDRCSTDDEPVEFVLYYLYRKHMTDVHNEKFDAKLCKYCGHRCSKHNLLMYHLHTKHGMKPPPNYNFPKCDQCPFIALSPHLLAKHKLKHDKNEIQCVECKLTFTSQTTLTSHIQITGHTGKSNKNNYDCQYCTKRYQSGVNLFSHVRLQHRNEAMRDGIVSIEEGEDVEDDDEEESKDEYILPEIISDPTETPKKVNILSNVKVQERHQSHQQLTLEPSSEAEALNNVATGIATSLGLVDIVVINENQQLFIQPDQQGFNEQTEQPEFILPELTQNQNEVITSQGVLTQSMLSSGDITSTDELVMVLTDHDYGDNQEEINNDNSNIVVLYSHPVDGQQDQFITSQGNIMVNSQTGMIEIRNGATITSTANQVVMNPQETQIESIEMIQREIESHGELKEEEKPIVEEKNEEEPEKEPEPVVPPNDALIESLTQGSQLEFTSPLTITEEPEKPIEQPKEVEENVEENQTPCEADQVETNEKIKETEVVEEPQIEESLPEPVAETPVEDDKEEEPETVEQNEEQIEINKEEVEGCKGEEEENQTDVSKEEDEGPSKVPSSVTPEKEEECEKEELQTCPVEIEEPNEEDKTQEENNTETPMEIEESNQEDKTQEENNAEQELSQSDTSTSQFNDENSQSSQDSQNKDVSTKISILDDWEDTDSQQSDNKEKEKVAGETVHKLMDDWEEEEEDDKKDNEG
ncbi:centrosome-associated zinc finger protein CP190 [Tribolium madens]|uniref:centrosome-associated zinc finger protein CP190 n=1 Tax=Tribolium madens TaxID=41895 RepID=UPI001CF75FAD|nr:centrosome-associated zinc finger protein CP190 [Tribolium madens]XP_044261731.1 centrosome-associated zinc finger protein CP190 [Tribolium madens]